MLEKRLVVLLLLALSLLADSPPPAAAAEFNFINLADPDTAIPGGTGTFDGVGQPAISLGKVAFKGWGGGGQVGIYMRDVNDAGSLVALVDGTTAVPGGTGVFTEFSHPSLSDGDLAFRAEGSDGEIGIYTIIDGTLGALADTTTAIPGGTGTFTDFLQPFISGGEVTFEGHGSSFQEGIYTNVGGMLRVVANQATGVPGGTGTFPKFFGLPDVDDGEIAFGNFSLGIYLEREGALSAVADLNTPLPGGSGNFGFFPPGTNTGRLEHGTILFVGGASSSDFALYRVESGVFTAIVDTNTTVPGTAVRFTTFAVQGIAVSGNDVAFLGAGADSLATQAVFTTLGGGLTRVAGNGDMLDGTVISTLGVYTNGIDGNMVAFNVGNYGDAGGGFGDSANFVAVLASTTTTTTTITPVSSTSSTTTTLPTPDDLAEDLGRALPDPAMATGKARRSANSLARYARRVRNNIEKGLSEIGRKRQKRYKKARRDLRRLLGVADKANRKGHLGVPFEPIEDAATALRDALSA
jgi:hypothetical protein